MIMDNDFPMTMANGPMGFLQTYVKGMQDSSKLALIFQI